MLCPLSLPCKKSQAVSPSYAQSKAQINHPQIILWLLVAVLNATCIALLAEGWLKKETKKEEDDEQFWFSTISGFQLANCLLVMRSTCKLPVKTHDQATDHMVNLPIENCKNWEEVGKELCRLPYQRLLSQCQVWTQPTCKESQLSDKLNHMGGPWYKSAIPCLLQEFIVNTLSNNQRQTLAFSQMQTS